MAERNDKPGEGPEDAPDPVRAALAAVDGVRGERKKPKPFLWLATIVLICILLAVAFQ